MTQQMIDDLLELITLWLEDIKDIKANSHHIDELIVQLEAKACDVGIDISGLEETIQHIDNEYKKVLRSCTIAEKRQKIIGKVAN